MGDTSHHARWMSSDQHESEALASSTSPHGSSQQTPNVELTSQLYGNNQPLQSQHSSHPSTKSQIDPQMAGFYPGTPTYNPSPAHTQPSPFNMGAIAGSHPEFASPSPRQIFQSQGQSANSRHLAGASTPTVVYQLQQSLQYPPPTERYQRPDPYSYVPAPFPAQYGATPGIPRATYGSGLIPEQRGPAGMTQQVSLYQQNLMQYHYYQDPYGRQAGQPSTFQGQRGHFGAGFRGSMTVAGPGMMPQQMPEGTPEAVAMVVGYTASLGQSQVPGGEVLEENRQETQPSADPIPRGPPRKPKQSGYALWVGNLPPGAAVMDLKEHFSRDATEYIESLFLISKSNCAFVNYRSEAACVDAMHRFRDSRFQGVRLACRLRRSSTSAPGIPTGPSSMAARRRSQLSTPKLPGLEGNPKQGEETEQPMNLPAAVEKGEPSKLTERYFIMKSLTLQDLEQCVRNGIWATQTHNEEALNKAFVLAENVYLIFSANKSGEYFGYARMASPISEKAAEIFGTIPRAEAPVPVGAPKSISTPATEFAPKGRIIDDFARGTIFWEAEHSDEETDESEQKDEASDGDGDSGEQIWGKPFKVEWISTNRLPFYRTRGLRNPWNANREVKIARDGTELEPSVGKRLLQIFKFHRTAASVAPGPSTD